MKKIVLVDASSYKKQLDSSVAQLKRQYFQVKNNLAKQYFGKTYNQGASVFSIGLLRIATLLRANNCQVKFITLEQLQADMQAYVDHTTFAVLFGVVTPTVMQCNAMAQQIKQHFATTCYCGGAGVLLAAELTAQRCQAFDYVLTLTDRQAVAQILGVSLKMVKQPHNYVEYDILPLPLTQYSVNTFTVLGCPFSCAYCQDNRIEFCEARLDADLPRILPQLLPDTRIHIFDSVFGYSQQRAKQAAKAIAQCNTTNALISCDLRAEMIDKELVLALKEANIMDIRLGFESVSGDVLGKNSRTQSLQVLERALDIVKDNSDIYVSLYCAVGLPASTPDSFKHTREYLQQCLEHKRVQEVRHCVYVPYPKDGVNYANQCVYIHDYDWRNYDRQSFPVYHTDKLSSKDIWQEFIDMMQMEIDTWKRVYSIDDSITQDDVINEYVFQKYVGK